MWGACCDNRLPGHHTSLAGRIRACIRTACQELKPRYRHTSNECDVYVVPPAVPPDREQALESAFARTFADKEFLAEADKGKLQIDPMIGEEIHQLVVEFLGMSPDMKAKLQNAMKAGKK